MRQCTGTARGELRTSAGAACQAASARSRREQHRVHHAAGVGDAAAGDVERGAVIDRRADDRQAQRDVHGLAEREQLHGHQALIVVAGDDDVELAAVRAHEHGVGGQRPDDVDAAGPARPPRRARSPSSSSCPIRPCSPACGLSPATAIRGRSHAEPRQLARGQRDRAGHQVARERPRHLGERDVDGREHDAQLGRVEHHRDEAAAGEVAEQVGVPAPRQARQRERLLADGRRRDRRPRARPSRRPTARTITSYAARPAAALRARRARTTSTAGGRVDDRARSRRARARRRPPCAATSGPMPAGSPTVSAMRGRMRLRTRRGSRAAVRPDTPL